MSIPKKKKHVSKKNKKDWRKHCDIRDVEEFLEDQRLEERLGQFDLLPDNELFVVDTGSGDTGGGDTEDGNEHEVKDVKPLSAKLQKRAKLVQTPKCFEVLLPSSKVKDPIVLRNHVNAIGSAPTALSKLTDKRRFEKGVYQKKIENARKNRKIALEKKRKSKQIRQTFDKDLWGKDLPSSKGIPETLCDDFMSPEAQIHNVLHKQRMRPKPPLPQTVATRAAVETPHPGVSYNPTYQEHQALLSEVVKHEEKMIKREKHLQRVTTGMFSRVTAQEKENQWHEEMSEGLPRPHNPSTDKTESDSEGDEYKAINPPVKNKKKDHKARRKQKEKLQEMERLKRKKIDKKKITDIYKLRKLQKSITKKEKLDKQSREKRAEKRAEIAATTLPNLNAHKAPIKEPEFVDPASLSGDLRHINPSTNLLKDRYQSLQRRGALAAAKLMMKKKRKLKSYFKPGHKVTDHDVQAFLNKKAANKKQ